eukprot:scaffold22660_cov127-Cylindrotheca_fusiformis.AAC.11
MRVSEDYLVCAHFCNNKSLELVGSWEVKRRKSNRTRAVCGNGADERRHCTYADFTRLGVR